jgi:hypothetical protein
MIPSMVATPSELVQRAVGWTGLSDLGPDGWQDGLEHLVAAIGTDVDDVETITWIEDMIVGRLVNRLRVEQWYSEHPDDAARPVEGPLVVVGLPRTGTTALHHLLSLNPRFRHLRRWELKDPVPPPDAVTEAHDPRRVAERSSGDAQHIRAVDGPVEDGALHELAFDNSETVLPVASYTRWWRTADHAAAVVYHERLLRMLQSRRPPDHWLLKWPAYLFELPAFAAQYPDAQFVVTHRDPLAVLPSTCSTVLAGRQRRLPRSTTEPMELGQEVLDHWRDGVAQAGAARSALGEERFLDVGQHEIEADAVGTAERIHEFADLPLPGGVRDAMQRWAQENRRGSRGEHRYSVEQFGLTPATIRSAFAAYLDRFGQHCRPAA